MSEFQAGVEEFIMLIVERLASGGISNTNLQRVWADLEEERDDPKKGWYRRLEAALGFDPDEAAEDVIAALIEDENALGRNAIAEIATGTMQGKVPLRATELRELVATAGVEARFTDIPRLGPDQASVDRPAWEIGEAGAQTIRSHAGLGSGGLTDEALAEFVQAGPAVVRGSATAAPLSFALEDGSEAKKIVLHSGVPTSRRFALARLIGDWTLCAKDEPLIPVTSSDSYRQKIQRAFAAELLCPFQESLAMLDGDLGEENRERVAASFDVSPLLVTTQLVNKDLLPRRVLRIF